VLLLLILAISAFWQVGGPIASLRALDSIGSATRDDVRRLIGQSAEIEGDSWVYTKIGNPGWLLIEFDEQGRVESFDHEYGFK
jgi:hypothetical protein